ncbi:MAG: GNAT family N-acetyltransferase [Ignavibacteria bacterium]
MEIKNITPEETTNLRQLTLRQHQKAEELIYDGDHDKDTVHFGAFVDSNLEGIASIYKEGMKEDPKPDSWRLRGMATSERIRGKGYGTILMNRSIEHIKKNNGKLFWCNARITAEPFYEKFGMKRTGEVFYPEDLGPHIVMWMEIK